MDELEPDSLFGHILPAVIEDSEVWKEFFTAVDEAVHGPLIERMERLRNSRNMDWIALPILDTPRAKTLNGDADRHRILLELADLLGYHYTLGELDADHLYRFVEASARYIPDNGSILFENYMSYALNAPIELRQLWYDRREDAYSEVTDAIIQGRRLVLDGETTVQDVFPTQNLRLVLTAGKTSVDADAVVRLFNSIAPATLQIRDVKMTFKFEMRRLNLLTHLRTKHVQISKTESITF